jgi:hypothetical protein
MAGLQEFTLLMRRGDTLDFSITAVYGPEAFHVDETVFHRKMQVNVRIQQRASAGV